MQMLATKRAVSSQRLPDLWSVVSLFLNLQPPQWSTLVRGNLRKPPDPASYGGMRPVISSMNARRAVRIRRPFPFVDPERLLWEMSLMTQDPTGRLHAPTSSVGGGSQERE
jgi:hypothetical protein